tara:strand:+ start:1122 stop:3764 length:2643 start_codon:yes stop_codon:yes gene_type:complete
MHHDRDDVQSSTGQRAQRHGAIAWSLPVDPVPRAPAAGGYALSGLPASVPPIGDPCGRSGAARLDGFTALSLVDDTLDLRASHIRNRLDRMHEVAQSRHPLREGALVASQVAVTTGKVVLRPWRVGIALDIADPTAVREAIRALSSVWGGIYMPLLNVNDGIDRLKEQGAAFDVDSLYSDIDDEELQTFLRSPGWAWQGYGEYGPLVDNPEPSIRHGLLKQDELVDVVKRGAQPQWPDSDPDDLAYAAMFGLPRLSDDPQVANSVSVVEALMLNPSQPMPGLIHATASHLTLSGAEHRKSSGGVLVLRPGNTHDVVRYWNHRAMGIGVTTIPGGAAPDTLEALLASPLPTQTWKSGGVTPTSRKVLPVCGAEDADIALLGILNAQAARLGATVTHVAEIPARRDFFPGITTRFARSFSHESRPTAQMIEVPLPELPLVDRPSSIWRGVIAAELQLHTSQGHDPRLTAAIPPYRRHSQLLEQTTNLRGIRQRRSAATGQVMGVDATADTAPVVFASNLEVLQRLFDDSSVEVSQSSIGKFQSRAAERLGGPFGGLFNQPGARAVLTETARKGDGLHLDHLRRIFVDNKGVWPGWFYGDQKSYGVGEVHHLLNTGLFVPMSRVHCAHCRVDRWLSADELATRVECELCGEQFNLALSHSLVKPEWRYRLAAHLRPDQVDSLVSVLATASLLGQFRHVEEPMMPHVLGLELTAHGKKIEVDVAVYLPDHDWAVVLGEVKTHSRIDDNDVRNLELLEKRLSQAGVRTVTLFATMKDEFNEAERAALRARVERSRLVKTSRGDFAPNVPLVLTASDLSHPAMSKDHPWRWDHNYQGLLGTGLTSCKRNLGLENYGIAADDEINWRWSSPLDTPAISADTDGESGG